MTPKRPVSNGQVSCIIASAKCAVRKYFREQRSWFDQDEGIQTYNRLFVLSVVPWTRCNSWRQTSTFGVRLTYFHHVARVPRLFLQTLLTILWVCVPLMEEHNIRCRGSWPKGVTALVSLRSHESRWNYLGASFDSEGTGGWVDIVVVQTTYSSFPKLRLAHESYMFLITIIEEVIRLFYQTRIATSDKTHLMQTHYQL